LGHFDELRGEVYPLASIVVKVVVSHAAALSVDQVQLCLPPAEARLPSTQYCFAPVAATRAAPFALPLDVVAHAQADIAATTAITSFICISSSG